MAQAPTEFEGSAQKRQGSAIGASRKRAIECEGASNGALLRFWGERLWGRHRDELGRLKVADAAVAKAAKMVANAEKAIAKRKTELEILFAEPNETIRLYKVDGVWTDDRKELHRKIVSSFFEGKTPVDDPVFYVLGGGPASGKTYVLREKSKVVRPPANTVEVDVDEIKKMLPEYREGVLLGVERAAGYVHEESSELSKIIMQIANEKGYNILLDGTGDGSVASITKKIQDAKKAGHRVEGYYATVPTELALEREAKRAKESGRKVKREVVVGTHKKVSDILPQVADQFDVVYLYDTTDGAVLIATGGNGSGLIPVEGKEADLQRFIDKANDD